MSEHHGGTTTAVSALVAAVAAQGVRADIVTSDDGGPSDRLHQAQPDVVTPDASVRILLPRQTNFYSVSVPLIRWLYRYAKTYDVIHSHGLFNFFATVAPAVARVIGVPYILSPHGMLAPWCLANRRPLLKKLSMSLLEAAALRRAAAIHVTTASELQTLESLGYRDSLRCVPLPLGTRVPIATKAFPGIASALNNISVDDNCMLFLSRITPVKRLHIIIEALPRILAQHPAARLLIAGAGDQKTSSACRILAEALGVSSRITWLGFVTGSEKEAVFRRAQLFLLPSSSENFGYAVAEAMQAGLPVVVARGVGIADLVARSGAGYVIDSTAPALAAAVISLLSNTDSARRMGERGRSAASTELSLCAVGKQLVTMYSDAISLATRSN